jgi:hypothetical protein
MTNKVKERRKGFYAALDLVKACSYCGMDIEQAIKILKIALKVSPKVR